MRKTGEHSRIGVRDARVEEADAVVEMLRCMLTDMAVFGGRAPARDATAWQSLAASVAQEIGSADFKYLVAETECGDRIGLAMAKVIELGGALAPLRTIHLSIMYVAPGHRRTGIGGLLLARALDWGRAVGAVDCTLNVLADNPALRLYQRHGFTAVGHQMSRPL